MNEKDFTDMLMAELVKQLIDEAESEMVDSENEEKQDFDHPLGHLYKLAVDQVYKSAWSADKNGLEEKLKIACEDLYGGSVRKEFPFIEFFIIGLYGMVAKARADLSVEEFVAIINENCDLINDLY